MSMLKGVIDYARAAMSAEFGDIEVQSRSTETTAIAEIMRRINYNPNPRDLVGSRGRWRGVFVPPIANPKSAKRQYSQLADDMNQQMVDSLMAALKRRAAGFPPMDWSIIIEWKYDHESDTHVAIGTDKLKAQLDIERAAVAHDQTIEGVVDRLLETAPLDDARWGGW